MRTSNQESVAMLSALLLSACAHIPSGILSDVQLGMNRESAIRSVQSSPTFYYLKDGSTEYVLFQVVSSFTAMYSEYPYQVEFIRLENDRVVVKGLVGKSEEQRIRTIRPTFVLREWQGKGEVSADHHDDGR